MANHQVDVLIIGAGPSGASAAALIQRAVSSLAKVAALMNK